MTSGHQKQHGKSPLPYRFCSPWMKLQDKDIDFETKTKTTIFGLETGLDAKTTVSRSHPTKQSTISMVTQYNICH